MTTLSGASSSGTAPPRRGVGTGLARVARRASSNAHLRLLLTCILSSLVLAVITGPEGSAAAPTSGFTGSLSQPRVWWFVGLGVALFVLRSLWMLGGARLTAIWRRAKAATAARLGLLAVRIVLELCLIGFGFAYVTWISVQNTWKGGLCVQLGAALLAMECVIEVRKLASARAGRLVAYAFVAAYGALISIHGHASRYLNRIGAVPHNPVLGKFLLYAALGLCIIDLALFVASRASAGVPRRRARTALGYLGVALLAYGWLTWTGWTQWRATAPRSVAHWLSSEHLLVHDHDAGLVVMALGVLALLAAAVWVAVEQRRTRDTTHAASAEPSAGFLHVRTPSVARPALMIAILLLALEWPLHMDPASVSNIDTQIMPFVLMALGLNIVIGFAGLLDLGYVAFYAIGAYVTAYFTGALTYQPPFVLDSLWVIPFAIGAAMLSGALLGTPTLRLRGDYLAIVTLGFGEIIQIFANNLSTVTGGAAGIPGTVPGFTFHLITPFLTGSQQWSPITYIPFYYLILGVVIVSMVSFNALNHSRVGRSWTAIREDEIAADSLGINALKYKVMAFAIGASTGGLAGVFLVSQNGTLFPTTFIIQVSITVVACVVFGGMGSIPGAVAGAVIIAGLPAYLQQHNFTWYNPNDFTMYLGAILIVMMIFRPQGIIPSRRRRREIALTEAGIDAGRANPSLQQSGPITAETQ